MQDGTWLVFVKTFRITSVFFLGGHYHRFRSKLNIYGMNSVDVLAIVKIYQKIIQELRDAFVHEWNNIPTIDWLYASRCGAVVAAGGAHTRFGTLQISILHDNFCLSMISSDNDVETFCSYCLMWYAHMNLIYTIFVDFLSLCKTILCIRHLYHFFCWLVYVLFS